MYIHLQLECYTLTKWKTPAQVQYREKKSSRGKIEEN